MEISSLFRCIWEVNSLLKLVLGSLRSGHCMNWPEARPLLYVLADTEDLLKLVCSQLEESKRKVPLTK